jgi:hypothetical protein
MTIQQTDSWSNRERSEMLAKLEGLDREQLLAIFQHLLQQDSTPQLGVWLNNSLAGVLGQSDSQHSYALDLLAASDHVEGEDVFVCVYDRMARLNTCPKCGHEKHSCQCKQV